jgi:outer membrane protein assembly factor BamB
MKLFRPLSLLALLALCPLAIVAAKRNAFPWQGVGSVSEIIPQAVGTNLTPIKVAPTDWPWWQGGLGNGASAGKAVTEWSETRNILWKVPVPGIGHASPIVCAERVFIATADEQQQTQSLLCFDRQTGTPLWSRIIHTGGFMQKHAKNSQASATPACDGERVCVAFLHAGGLWVTAVDFAGNIVWQTQAGPFVSEHGYGSSPVIWKSFVLVNGESLGGGFLAALDRQTGALAWRKRRPNHGANGSYGSPLIANLAGKPQLIQSGAGKVSSYDPATGGMFWQCDGPAQVTANTVACDDNHVIASGGYPEKLILCIRADGSGDVTNSHVVWRTSRGVAYVPSPLIADGLAYIIQDGPGLLSCFEIASGKQMWKQRLRGEFTASPVRADGLLYLANESGTVFVVRAGREYELVATNQLDEGALATPAIAGGRIYLRTAHHLYCIGRATKENKS